MAVAGKLKLGNIPVVSGSDALSRMAILLWGPATVGKTTFAATAPGVKLWLSMGDNEHIPVAHRKDVMVANLSGMNVDDFFTQAQGENPFGLDNLLSEREEIETVVFDNVTALAHRALQKAVKEKVGAGKDFTPTIMAPGLSAYGGRNGLVLEVVQGLLRVTARHNVHIIVTAHENDPEMRVVDGKEVIDKISIMLGGQIVNNVTWRLSEVWHLRQLETGNKDRKLAVRPVGLRRPMKTRMFDGKGDPDFTLKYDADKPDKGQMTIASFYDQWLDAKGAKIKVPK